MGWQSFARWGSSGLQHQVTSQQSSFTALQTFLDGLMDRLNHLSTTQAPSGPFHDFFTRLTDMVNDLRSGSHSPAPLGTTDDTPPDGQAPAPQSTDPTPGNDGHSNAPVAPQGLLDDDDTPGSDDAPDGDDDGETHQEDDDAADDGQDDGHHDGNHDAPGHEESFSFRDFLDPQGGNGPALSPSLMQELTHFLQDEGGGGLAALLSQLQNLPQDLRDALQNSVAQAEQSHDTGGSNDDHGHHQWDHLI